MKRFSFVDEFSGEQLDFEGAAPLEPPEAWFSQEAADAAPEKLRVFPGGRVAGVIAPKDRCLLSPGRGCWMVPRPRSDAELDLAHTGFTKTASGSTIRTGILPGAGGHASEWASASNAQRAYADTSTQLMRGRYVWSDKAGGLTFVGAVWPEVTPRQIAEIEASPASVDYRYIEDERAHRLVGACLVNIGGLPTRWRAAVASAGVRLVPQRQPGFVRLAAADGEAPGAMVALRVEWPALAVEGGLPPDELHVTLGYFGRVEYPPEVREAAFAAVAQVVEAAGPILLTVNGPAVLGPPEEQVVVLLVQGEGLVELREACIQAAVNAGLVLDDTWPVWLPHLTIGPLGAVPLEAAAALAGVQLSPPGVVVAFGGEWDEVPLPRVGAPIEAESFLGTGPTATLEVVCECCGKPTGATIAAPALELPVLADAYSWCVWKERTDPKGRDCESLKVGGFAPREAHNEIAKLAGMREAITSAKTPEERSAAIEALGHALVEDHGVPSRWDARAAQGKLRTEIITADGEAAERASEIADEMKAGGRALNLTEFRARCDADPVWKAANDRADQAQADLRAMQAAHGEEHTAEFKAAFARVGVETGPAGQYFARDAHGQVWNREAQEEALAGVPTMMLSRAVGVKMYETPNETRGYYSNDSHAIVLPPGAGPDVFRHEMIHAVEAKTDGLGEHQFAYLVTKAGIKLDDERGYSKEAAEKVGGALRPLAELSHEREGYSGGYRPTEEGLAIKSLPVYAGKVYAMRGTEGSVIAIGTQHFEVATTGIQGLFSKTDFERYVPSKEHERWLIGLLYHYGR